MKKAIGIRAFSDDPDFQGGIAFLKNEDDYARCFEKAVRYGFEAIQLYVASDGYLSLDSPPKRVEAIARRAADAGLALASLEPRPFSFSLMDDDAEVRRQGEATVRRAMELARLMGSPGVLTIPGYVGLPWDPTVRPIRYDFAYERLRESLRRLAPDAERLGVAILIENIWNMFMYSPLEMRGLIDEVDSPCVRVLLDTGNIVPFGFPEQWIRILGPRIREVHLKDYRRAVGTIHGFVSLLEGDVNWPEVMAALREIQYDGVLIAEVFPHKHHGEAILSQTSDAMDRIMGRKRREQS